MGSTKQMKTVAVLGSTGMLGYAVSAYYSQRGYKVIEINHAVFDALQDDITTLKPKLRNSDFIINCIGVIKPRIISMKPEEVLVINGIFPKNLAKLAKSLNIPCFHITTDCVFSGSKGNYSELDYFDITDLYGLSKSAGETTECMTLRTSIIGEEKVHKYSLLEWALTQKDQVIAGFKNHYWNGVTTLYLAEIIEKIITEKLYSEGVYHIYSPKSVTKYDLLKLISDAYSLNITINAIDATEKVNRALTSNFPLTKKLVTKTIKNQIKEMYDFFCKYK